MKHGFAAVLTIGPQSAHNYTNLAFGLVQCLVTKKKITTNTNIHQFPLLAPPLLHINFMFQVSCGSVGLSWGPGPLEPLSACPPIRGPRGPGPLGPLKSRGLSNQGAPAGAPPPDFFFSPPDTCACSHNDTYTTSCFFLSNLLSSKLLLECEKCRFGLKFSIQKIWGLCNVVKPRV